MRRPTPTLRQPITIRRPTTVRYPLRTFTRPELRIPLLHRRHYSPHPLHPITPIPVPEVPAPCHELHFTTLIPGLTLTTARPYPRLLTIIHFPPIIIMYNIVPQAPVRRDIPRKLDPSCCHPRDEQQPERRVEPVLKVRQERVHCPQMRHRVCDSCRGVAKPAEFVGYVWEDQAPLLLADLWRWRRRE